MLFTTENFETEVLKAETPVMVDFFADWCGPCKMMGPLVEKLAEKYAGQMKVGKLNVDDDMDIAQKYEVASIPTFIFFKNGEVVKTLVGGMPVSELEENIKEVL